MGASQTLSVVWGLVILCGLCLGAQIPLPTCTTYDKDQAFIASANKLMLYNLQTKESRTLHEGHGLYYSVFRGPDEHDPDTNECTPTVWVNTRKQDNPGELADDNKHDGIILLKLSEPPKVIYKLDFPFCGYAHAMVRFAEKLYLVDTGHGYIWEFDYPSFDVTNVFTILTSDDHPNNIGVDEDFLYVMMHGGSSGIASIAKIDRETGYGEIFSGIGAQAHQVTILLDGTVLYLDSLNAAFKLVNLEDKSMTQFIKLDEDPTKYLKGLLVQDNIAYFGVAIEGGGEWRGDLDNDVEILAFDLQTFEVVYREQIESDGLVNSIVQPFASNRSPYKPTGTAPVNVDNAPYDTEYPITVTYRSEQGDGVPEGTVVVEVSFDYLN